MLAFERFATKIDIVSCGCIPSPFRIMITYRVESPVARRTSARGHFVISGGKPSLRTIDGTDPQPDRPPRLMHFLLRTDDGPVAEACSSFQARRRARCRRFLSPPPRPGSAFFGSSARGTCRQRRHLGRRGRRDMAGRDARRSTGRPTAPDRFRRRKRTFCVCAHQPRIAGDISGQSASAAARPALRSMFPPTPAHPR